MTITEIFQETRDLCDTDSGNYDDTTLLRRVNSSIETLVSMIKEYTRPFPFDDQNFGNIAIGTFDLDEGVARYTINDRFLGIIDVKVKDKDGKLHLVTPTTQREESEILETLEAQTGLPTKYRGIGRTIYLSPAPTASSVTLTDGLQLTYQRTSYQITSNDVSTGALVPGIATPWHITICRMSALPYYKLYKRELLSDLQKDIDDDIHGRRGQDGILTHYAKLLKDKDERLAPIVHDTE